MLLFARQLTRVGLGRPSTSRASTLIVRAASNEGEKARAPRKSSARAAPAAGDAALAKAPKAPPKPKILRAPTAFNLFFKAYYPEVKKVQPDAGLRDAAAAVRDKWATLSPEAKAPYEKEAAEKKKVVDEARAKALAEKKANQKPPTAYMLFAQKNRAAVVQAQPGLKVTEVASILGQKWKALSAEEQQKYKDESKRLTDAWKAKQQKAA